MKLPNTPTCVLKFKQHFKNLNYYSMPISTLFVLRKRVHFLTTFIILLVAMFYTWC